MNNIGDLYDLDGATDRILVTCALPYVNNVPHLGNLVPIVSADTYTRYLKLKGISSIYICATDEHGTRTEIEAARAGVDEETYCRDLHGQMRSIFDWFNVDFDHFGRTSHRFNHELTQSLFLKAEKNGFVEEREIEQLFCRPCDRYLPDTFVEGRCPFCNTPGAKGDQCDACGKLLEPLELIGARCKSCGGPPEVRRTSHLFLKLDTLAEPVKKWILNQKHWDGIIRNMPLGWINEGMKPRAITRDLKWGVKVPRKGFEDKVFYVWFDAPIGYIASTAEWAERKGEALDDWWKGGRARLIHFLGKDNVPFHTIMWPATLIAADDGFNLPSYIAANEYLNYAGGAFSKSRDRGVFSTDVVEMGFPADAFRFFLMAKRPEKRDTDFSFEAFGNVVNADLVGNFGNLANRLLSFMAKRFGQIPAPGELAERDKQALATVDEKVASIDKSYAHFELRAAARHILELSDVGNGYLQSSAPWKSFKQDISACKTTLFVASKILHQLARWTWPIMPKTCETLLALMGTTLDGEITPGRDIGKPQFLFRPIEDETIAELSGRFDGANKEANESLTFEKRREISWPCVILELTDLTIRRRIKRLERWKDLQLETMDLDTIESSQRLKAYEKILERRDLGGRTVSVQNLIDIARREGKLPNINTLVDIYNIFSLREAIVMGAYERRTIAGKLIYAEADGQEHFIPVKGGQPESIRPGEWVLKDETNMVVTKVTTKQSEAAAVTTSTQACAMCIQGNPRISVNELQKTADEMVQVIAEHCGGEVRVVFAG